ncbi:MAG: hypothetical protein KYX62_05360 [Pseudomonadota bacterium]|nr:hypothetical protein [Pseudomonadota bacterium]
MVKKTLLSLAIAATAAGLAGCNISSVEKYNDDVDQTAVNSGLPGATPGRVAPVFSAGNKDLPLITDFIFSEAAATDGTASVDDTTPPVTTAMNSIEGASVVAPIDIEFNAPLDAESLNQPLAVNLIKLRNYQDDPDIDALDIDTIVANSDVENGIPQVVADDQPVAGVDYTVSFLNLDSGDTPTLRINLINPLDARSKYIVALTSNLKAENGENAGPSAEYELLSGSLELPSDALEPVRTAIQGWEQIAEGYLTQVAALYSIAKPDVILSYAFTTGGTNEVLKSIAAPKLYVMALASRPDTAKSLYLAVLSSLNGGDLTAVQTAYITNIIVPAATAESITLSGTPTAEEIAAVEVTDTYKTMIVTAASSSAVIDAVAATLYTPSSQTYKPIMKPASLGGDVVALSPSNIPAFTGTAFSADTLTHYVQGQLQLPVGLTSPALTNTQALASGDPATIAGAVKLSMASDSVWSAYSVNGGLTPPSDNKIFDPATGTLTSEGVTVVSTDEDGSPEEYSGGMTNVTYRYPLADLSETEYAPVMVTLPGGDYTFGGANPDTTAQDCSAYSKYPVLLYVHGITSDRTSSLAIGAAAASKGCFATVALDLPLHGVAPLVSDRDGTSELNGAMAFNVEQATDLSSLTVGSAEYITAFSEAPYANAAAIDGSFDLQERHFNIGAEPASSARVSMVYGDSAATSLGKSGDLFINLANMGRLRDNMREAVVDQMHLLASLADMDVDGDGVADLDADNVYVAGISLGAIVASSLVATVNDPQVQAVNGLDNGGTLPLIKGVVLSSPGGSLPKMLENSPAFSTKVLAGLNLAQDSSALQKYEAMLQTALNSVDPINFASAMSQQNTPVLMFSMVGGGDCPAFDIATAACSDGSQRLPSDLTLAFQGKYPADHVVPNYDYFKAADSNPFTNVMPGLTYELGDLGAKTEIALTEMTSSAMPLAGTAPLAEQMGLKPVVGDNIASVSGNKYVLQFDKGTHSTFAAADDTAVFTTMMAQMLTFFSGGTANGLNPLTTDGIKPAAE